MEQPSGNIFWHPLKEDPPAAWDDLPEPTPYWLSQRAYARLWGCDVRVVGAVVDRGTIRPGGPSGRSVDLWRADEQWGDQRIERITARLAEAREPPDPVAKAAWHTLFRQHKCRYMMRNGVFRIDRDWLDWTVKNPVHSPAWWAANPQLQAGAPQPKSIMLEEFAARVGCETWMLEFFCDDA